MWAVSSLVLACALVSSFGQDFYPACDGNAVRDGDDDRCELLQSGVGVVTRHAADHSDANAKSIGQEDGAVGVAESGLPDGIWKSIKSITSAIGGVKNLEGDFADLKNETKTFADLVGATTKKLVSAVNSNMTFKHILKKVEAAYTKIYEAAQQLVSTIKKIASDFMSGMGKVTPPKLKKAMNATLEEIAAKGQKFADSFRDGEHGIEVVARLNATSACKKVSHSLNTMKKRSTEFVTKALGISKKGLNKELKEAKALLPDAIKKKIDEILAGANDAVEHLEGSLGTVIKDFRHAVVGALKGHCDGLQSAAPRSQVGILTALVVGVFGLAV